MELIYAELTVVWVVTIALGGTLAIYHTALVACDAVKNLFENRRSKAMDRLASQAGSTEVQAFVEVVE